MKNKEIEELLKYLKDENWDYYPADLIPYKVLLMEERDLLLSYIEQLEKENEFLKLDNPSANIKYFEMLKENKRKIDNLRYQNKQLKNNRDKAIEIINIEKSKMEYAKYDSCLLLIEQTLKGDSE